MQFWKSEDCNIDIIPKSIQTQSSNTCQGAI